MPVVANESLEQFISNKYNFLSKDNSSKDNDFVFLNATRELFEAEIRNFTHLRHHQDALLDDWYRYCCRQLAYYYGKDGYQVAVKAQEFDALARGVPVDDSADDGEILKAIYSNLQYVMFAFISPSRLRTIIEILNIRRLQWIFLRKFLVTVFSLAHDKNLFDFIQKWFSIHIQLEQALSVLMYASWLLNIVGVAVFAVRLLISTTLAAKHILLPSLAEKELSYRARAINELKLRHAKMLNDLVWTLVNLLTNFAALFHISNPVAIGLTVVFMFFDLGLILWRRHLAYEEYLIKKLQYNLEKRHWSLDKPYANERLKEVEILGQENERNWQVVNATFYFNAVAAIFLASGFIAAVFFSPPVLALAGWMLCVLAVSMYMSSDEFSAYKVTQLLLEAGKVEPEKLSQIATLQEEYKSARKQLFINVLKKTFFPGILIATFVVSWQAALVLTAMLLIYASYKASIPKPTTPTEKPIRDALNADDMGLSVQI